MDDHQKRLQDIRTQVKSRAPKKFIKIYHGSSNSTRLPDFEGRHVVDTSALNHIIEINTEKKYAVVEPSVQLDELVEATLKHGLLPPVVMEFPGISVGGGIQGGAAESSSFKYSGFHHTALEYELVLGNGEAVKASRSERPDLFWGTACSYGSVGILTSVKLRLIAAQPYVSLRYRPANSPQQALEIIDGLIENGRGLDFIDAIIFSPASAVVMTGKFTDKPFKPLTTTRQPGDEWFYLHAKAVLKRHRAADYEECIPVMDYLFRYDRGGFWVGPLVFDYLKLPFTKLTRRLLDQAMHTRFLYRGVQKTAVSQRVFAQDIFMAKEKVPAFLEYVRANLDIWPLWLLPMKPHNEPKDIFGLPPTESKYAMNVGVWGKTTARNFEQFKQLNRAVEDEIMRLGAHKTLYAHSYFPKRQFWQIYDRKRYDSLRKQYHADGVFEDIYDKVTVTNEYTAPFGKALISHFKKKLTGRQPTSKQ